MVRIYGEPIRFCRPLFADEFVWGEALERIEPSPDIRGVAEVLKMSPQLIMCVGVEAVEVASLMVRFIGSARLGLGLGPRMIDPGEASLDAILAAAHFKHVGHDQ